MSADWTMELAIEINNRFELGLNERELRSLAFVIKRRAAPEPQRNRAYECLERP